MKAELSLIAIIVILFVADLVCRRKRKGWGTLPVALLALHILFTLPPSPVADAFGGMYHTSPLLSLVKSVLAVGTLIVFLMSHDWLRRPDTAHKQGEFYVLTLCTLLGMYLMVSAGHFLMLYIGLETASIPMAALVAFDKYRHHSAEAGAKYILTALFSSAILLYGISLLYAACGTLNVPMCQYANVPIDSSCIGTLDIGTLDIGTLSHWHIGTLDIGTLDIGTLSHWHIGTLDIAALAFILSGLAFKLSLVPFHLWTADVYQGAPTPVAAYLSVVSKGAAAFTLLILLLKVFAPLTVQWQTALWWLTVATITVANLFALRQQNLKRLMAFSSISQAGYLLLGIVGGTAQGTASLVFYILIYMFANLAAFAVIGQVSLRTGRQTVDSYNGLYATNPRLTFLLTLALFSLAGIPPFAGFFSKFFVFASAFHGGFRWLTFIALANTVLSLYYYLRIVKAMYIQPVELPADNPAFTADAPVPFFRTDRPTRLALALCTAAILLLGLASTLYQYLTEIATLL